MPDPRLAQLWFWIDCLQSHDSHQSLHTLAVDHLALANQPLGQAAAAHVRMGCVLLVQQPHQP